MRRGAILAAIVLLGLTACGDRYPAIDAFHTPSGHVTFGSNGTLAVRVAQTEPEREQGLMGVSSLPRDEGMAFVFPGTTTTRFWMKDTRISLSIAFVSSSRRIVSVQEMAPCERDPCPTYGPDRPYAYAIEANAGWFEAHGIRAGDEVTGFDGPFFS